MTPVYRFLFLFILFSYSNSITSFAQSCMGCTNNEVVGMNVICDFDDTPVVNCTIPVGEHSFSGQLFYFEVDDEDSIDSYQVTIPSGTEIYEVEWEVINYFFSSSGTINIDNQVINYTTMEFEDTLVGITPINPTLGPSTYNISITFDNPSGFHLLVWTVLIKVRNIDCDGMIALTGVVNDTIDEESMDWITSEQILESNAVVDYDARDSIILKPGFHAKQGSILHAFMDGCGNQLQYPSEQEAALRHLDISVKDNPSLEHLLVYPNPTTQSIQIEYFLEAPLPISLYLIDFSGRRIKILKRNKIEVGNQREIFDFPHELPEGIYQIVLETEKSISAKKVVYHKPTKY